MRYKINNKARIWVAILIAALFFGFIILTNTLTTYLFIKDSDSIFIDGRWQERKDSLQSDTILTKG